jgi:tetratricopeptide (TPR) repeat protein
MGNNEMIGPFGASTVFGVQSPPLSYVRFVLAIRETRLGQLLTAIGRKLTAGKQARSSWGGMRMFLENRIGPQDKRKEVVYESFRKNLEDILGTARRAGVPTILSTVAVNLKDCAPFSSLSETNLPSQNRALYDESLLVGIHAEGQSNYVQSAVQYEKAARVAPLSAEVQFRWASALLGQTNLVAALEHFEKARDFDELPFRADSSINRVIRETAARETGPGLVFDDVVGLVASNSPVGIASKALFYEHVHFNFDGNYRVARSWAAEAARFLPGWATNGAAADWATQDVCERRLGLTDWNRFSVLEDMVSRLSQPPFTGQANHKEQIEELQAAMREARSRMNQAGVSRATEIYHAALQKAPDDHRLHENFAEFLDLTGNLTASVTEWKRVAELLPQHHLAFFQTGRLLRRVAKLDEARLWLGKALALRPDLSEGWLELGNIHALQGKHEEALNEYTKARQLTPQDYRVYYHTGKALSKLHRGAEAMENFQEALRLRPRYWEARYALGEELAFSNHPAEARREFEQVIREKPDYALAHFNLGVALVQMGDSAGALLQFEETLRLDPENQTVAGYIEKLHQAKGRN